MKGRYFGFASDTTGGKTPCNAYRIKQQLWMEGNDHSGWRRDEEQMKDIYTECKR